ncbi:YceD family protein [Thiobacillus thioparus]|uniref:YceD family protein n=1 Tax=Thiobacillus thioparus TaxID=931 RepID=UPI00037D85B5|nr:YceD family protein [Thiobacillus thioparus]
MLPSVEVDPWRFCRDAQSWEIQSDVAVFPRLAHEFTQGTLFCRVVGRVDQRGSLSLQVSISGEVGLTCQRCLGSMPYTVGLERTLYLARNEAELERLDALPDSDAIQAGERLSLVELVEDEVLLSLPLAPMHAEGECSIRGAQ